MRGRRAGQTTLAQTYRFGAGVSAAAVSDALRRAPLVGADSIFGDRPGTEDPPAVGAEPAGRTLRGFSPAPGFRFDVELREREPGVFVASFAQPDRATPFRAGDAVWLVTDGSEAADGPGVPGGVNRAAGGALLDEEINTERAQALGAQLLTGPRPSLRRWLFFRFGHPLVMKDATERIAGLVST